MKGEEQGTKSERRRVRRPLRGMAASLLGMAAALRGMKALASGGEALRHGGMAALRGAERLRLEQGRRSVENRGRSAEGAQRSVAAAGRSGSGESAPRGSGAAPRRERAAREAAGQAGKPKAQGGVRKLPESTSCLSFANSSAECHAVAKQPGRVCTEPPGWTRKECTRRGRTAAGGWLKVNRLGGRARVGQAEAWTLTPGSWVAPPPSASPVPEPYHESPRARSQAMGLGSSGRLSSFSTRWHNRRSRYSRMTSAQAGSAARLRHSWGSVRRS